MEIEHSTLSYREAGMETVGRLNALWGVRLESIIDNEALSLEERRQRLTAKMLEAAFLQIDETNFELGVEEEQNKLENEDLITRALAGDVQLEPNISFSEKNFRIMRDYEGEKIKDFILTFTRRFEFMANAKTPAQLALEISLSGAFAIGTAMAKLAYVAKKAGATLLAAIRTGVTGVGMKTAIAVVVIILGALLLFLFRDNPKRVLGLIVNDTDDDLVVKDWRNGTTGGTNSDLYLEHGNIENFPQDRATGDLDSPLVQLRKRFYFEPDDEDNFVFAGFYYGNKKTGLRGVEGVMLFTSATNPVMYAHMFAVPYTKDNGCNMSAMTGARPNLPSLFRTMSDARRIRVDVTQHGVRMTSTVNHPRGGVVGLIATISKV